MMTELMKEKEEDKKCRIGGIMETIQGFITDIEFEPEVKWTRNFTPPTAPYPEDGVENDEKV